MTLALTALVVNEDEMEPRGVKTGASGLKGVCACGGDGADAGAG
jgi:hypothetical protein